MTSPATTRKAIACFTPVADHQVGGRPPASRILARQLPTRQHPTRHLLARWYLTIMLLTSGTLLANGGCASCRLPAIDPSGERLFLPTSQASTNLETCLPKPAFSAPPKPTPCPASELGSTAPVTYAPGIACAANSAVPSSNQACVTDNQQGPPPAIPAAPPPSKAKCNGPTRPTPGMAIPVAAPGMANSPPGQAPCRNQLQLLPTALVAQVGTEIILVTGYRDEEGQFVTRQPIEWMLTQDSAGQFLEVGSGHCDCIHRLIYEQPHKVNPRYAIGFSSTKSELLTRGTPSPCDDVQVQKGQTWISLSSPQEGTSVVTAFVPKSCDSPQRRQTATIHWLDANWQLPGLAVVKAGERHVLSTKVCRSSNGTPQVGWLVRYQILDGTAGRFANGGTEIEVPTNADGIATAELVPQTATTNTIRVATEIVRPENVVAAGSPRLTIARGETLVTWSAMGLTLDIAGPETIPLNATAPFRITLTNQGDMPARDIIVSDVLPPNLKFIASNPQGQLFGDHVEWRLGDLPGRSSRAIDVQLQAIRPGDVRYCARARSADGLAVEGCHERSRVFAPALLVQMTGPQVTEVGGEATFQIDVTNQTNAPLTNVRLVDRFDLGLTEVSGKQGPLLWPLDSLGAGETRRVAITFVARQPGQLCHVVEATADGGHVATTRACVTASLPLPGSQPQVSPLRIQFAANPRQEVGRDVEYQFSVNNSGSQPLTNVRVVFQYKGTLAPTEASPGFQAARGQLSWLLPRLNPDERRSLAVKCRAVEIDPQATARITATADAIQPQSSDAQTEITGPGGAGGSPDGTSNPLGTPPPLGAAPNNSSAQSGELTVTMADTDDPVNVGQVATYLIIVKNDRPVSDRNVAVSVRLPAGYDASRVRVTGPTDALPLDPDGRTIRWRPVTEIRPGETLRPYRLELTTQPPVGPIVVQAEVRSGRNPGGVVAEAETTVAGR